MRPEGISQYGGLCAWTLARAHARSGDRVAIAAYLGGSKAADEAFADYAAAYADRNESDHGGARGGHRLRPPRGGARGLTSGQPRPSAAAAADTSAGSVVV